MSNGGGGAPVATRSDDKHENNPDYLYLCAQLLTWKNSCSTTASLSNGSVTSPTAHPRGSRATSTRYLLDQLHMSTGAGEDHGIDPNKNRLRSPYVSVRCISLRF